jgi:tetratricopeptide (TPR) repeat protein
MTSHNLRRAVRAASWIAVVLLVVFVAFAVYTVVRSKPSDATAQRLTVAMVMSGALSAAAAVTATALAVRQVIVGRTRISDLLAPKLLEEDRLVNRSTEMRDLVAQIDGSRIVGCHGPRGAGKSFLLEHLTDVVNGHRRAVAEQPRPRRLSAALYFDLSDAAGFGQIQAQVGQVVLGDADATWDDIVASVKRRFRHRRVLLILDNVNSPGLWRDLGEAVYRYRAGRPNDRIVFGSIEPISLGNLPVEHVPVLGLDLKAAKELLAARDVAIGCDELVELHKDCEGLPMYLRLLAGYRDGTTGSHGRSALDEQLVPELPPDARRVLSYAALIALFERRISLSELERYPVPHVDDQLAIAVNRTLVTPVPDGGVRRFKVHDLVRDSALRVLDEEVVVAAGVLCERATNDGELEHAALYAMFGDPATLGEQKLDALLEPVIRTAVKARNYALLGTLHARAKEHGRILEYISADPARVDLFCFARASELAGLGHYAEAEAEVMSSSVVRTRWHEGAEGTDLQADLRFLQADVAHLLNRYDEAAQMFEDLGAWAASTGRPGLHARCVWGHGHVLRHQGRDLDGAYALFESAVRLGELADELFPRAYSITGAAGIRVLLESASDHEVQRLADIEREIAATSTHDGYMLEVWKTQAQVAWLRGHRHNAADIVDAAIERALALNDRLLFNLYFERAEYERLRGEHGAALADYQLVLEFGTGNGDRNLISNALLGLVLVDLADERWPHHETPERARAAALNARQIAIDADIQITARIAAEVAAMVDDAAPAPQSVRLILL